MLALIVTVSFTHSAIAGVQAAQAINGEVTVKTPATITPTPTAFASAVNVTTKTIPVTKTISGDQTALAVKPLTRTVDSAAEEAAAQPTRNTRRLASGTRLVTTTTRATSSGRSTFPSGYCTYWAAQQTGFVDWHGNANQWGRNAAALGHKVGKEYVAAGAIVQTRESSVGHVAYVKEVKGNQITISEMNFKGRGVVSERTLNVNDPKIVTFIQQ